MPHAADFDAAAHPRHPADLPPSPDTEAFFGADGEPPLNWRDRFE